MIKRLLSRATHRIYSLPIIVLMPHSSCNCRCVMCDIWKANHHKKEISVDTLKAHVEVFKKLHVREVVLSGGEALLHSNLWNLCAILHQRNIRITLLSTGLLLKKCADEIDAHIDQVIVSLDGSEEVHNRIRNIPNCFARIAEGITELKKRRGTFRITGRCVLQRGNYFDFPNIVNAARRIGLDQISFLAADVSSQAFNHPDGWSSETVGTVALSERETLDFDEIVKRSFIELQDDYREGFIAESPSKIARIVQYYKAVIGIADYPGTVCNAPWVSAVIESDGNVAPCFFHKAYGNIYDKSLLEIINSKEAVAFRKHLNVDADEICKKCVCSIRLRPYQ